MRLKNVTLLMLAIFAAILFASCAEATPVDECVANDPDGFFNGLIHGFICPFTFIVSLFDEEVAIYAINNSGGWYDFGFLIGASIILGAGARSR